MESIVVTLTVKYPEKAGKRARDLILPLDTQLYILVDALVDALEIKIDKNILRGFLSTNRSGKEEIFSLEKTLRDVDVKFGDFLVLSFQEISAMASLICVDGPEFDLERDEVIVGCHPDADVDLRSVPKQEFVSGIHAKIIFRDENYYLVDNDSANGTHINDQRISPGKETHLKEGDMILLGVSKEQGVSLYIKRRLN